MKQSPLRLEASYLDHISFQANPDIGPTAPSIPENMPDAFQTWGLRSSAEMSVISAEERRYAVRLRIMMGRENATAVSPYIFEICMVGLFTILDDFKGPPEKLVSINGQSVLYGSMRELIRQLSDRGPFFSITLPTVAFEPIQIPEEQPAPPL